MHLCIEWHGLNICVDIGSPEPLTPDDQITFVAKALPELLSHILEEIRHAHTQRSPEQQVH